MNEIMENMNELKDKLFAAIDTICKDYEAKKSEKKKLPCTKDEATKLIQEYTKYYQKDSGCNIFEFLNDYTE